MTIEWGGLHTNQVVNAHLNLQGSINTALFRLWGNNPGYIGNGEIPGNVLLGLSVEGK